MAALFTGAANPPALPDSYPVLNKELDSAVQAFMDEYRAAGDDARKALLNDPVREPRHRFTPRFLAAAQRRMGTAEAIPYWAWLLENGSVVDGAVGEQAAAHLLQDHIKQEGLVAAPKAFRRAAGLRGSDVTLRDLAQVIARSPYPAVRAEAYLQRGLLYRQNGDERDALESLNRVLTEAPGSDAAKHAKETLLLLAPLATGAAAPELDARDLHGRRVRLEELRGRVVLIDFWGMWCGPCVAQLPRLRALSERFGKQKFAIVGVNSDRDAAALRRFLAANDVRWTNVVDGDTTGPVAIKWRVNTWPATFLIDGAGVIRGRDLSFDELEKTIAALLREQPPKS